MANYPVESVLPALRKALSLSCPVILSAPPGSGKTTAVPPALLDEPWLRGRKILILEPRRLAARRAACFMAERHHQRVGETFGYHVRLDRAISAKTRVEFLTEGLLTQRILSDPELSDVGVIIFDEFHERSIAADTAFALTQELRSALRNDLRIIVMSATLQPGALLAALGPQAQHLHAEGRIYPIETHLLGRVSVVDAILKALREEHGSILAFLPGEGEIRAAERALLARDLPDNVTIHPLYASLDRREQDAAVATPVQGQRKVVLATSIAESSITIEGVRVVVDCGHVRVPHYDLRNGLTRLETRRIPRDRADQRRGRAGRTEPGVCYRLWDVAADATLPEASTPEILDTDLTQTALVCSEWGNLTPPWLTPPPEVAWQLALRELQALGALDVTHHITPLGRELVRFPVEPALASLIIQMRPIDSAGGCLLAAVLSELQQDTSLRGITDFRRVLDMIFRRRPERIFRLAARWLGHDFDRPRLSPDELAPYVRLAFPEHLARRRGATGGRYLTAAGFGAILLPDDPLGQYEWLLLIQLSEQDAEAQIRCAVPIEEAELSAWTPRSRETVEWNRQRNDLVAVEHLAIGAIVLKERPLTPEKIDEGARITALLEGASRLNLPWTKAAEMLRRRIAMAAKCCPEEGWPDVVTSWQWLAPSLQSVYRRSQLEKVDLYQALVTALSAAGLSLHALDALLPASLQMPKGFKAKINYDAEVPFIAVKLQDAFGLARVPALCRGRLPMTIHLLSPAGRPVQITQDLEAFWRGSYALVRKDMRGRYPKHNWPENPLESL